MSRLKSIPLSKAKTAYGLLQDVKRAILAEPRRANMSCYTDQVDPASPGAPACGTVGCFAGWVSILAGQGMVNGQAGTVKLLGKDLDYTFNDGRSHVFNSGDGDACALTFPGTPEHAQAVVDRINRFIQVNYKTLKARRLPSLRTRRAYAKDSL